MIVATNNKEKLKEIKQILKKYKITSLKEKNITIDIKENEKSFYKNAKKKAKIIYELTKEETIADDSGLCINILNDFPGVMTHRFLGNDATDSDRNNALLEKMKEYKKEERKAKVVCVIVYYNKNKIIKATGILNGYIAKEKRGKNGFGFDEIFELENGLTLAELSPEEKNKISARYLALKKIKEKLEKPTSF